MRSVKCEANCQKPYSSVCGSFDGDQCKLQQDEMAKDAEDCVDAAIEAAKGE